MVGFGTERKGAERVALLVEKGFGSLLDVGVFQMMPLLIAVAIAIARLLAANFWMAWVM